VVAANYSDVTGGGHLWVTSDGGVSWTDISGNLPDEPVWSIAVLPGPGQNILYVGAEDGVYISSDGGTTWDRAGQGLPNVQVRQLELNTGLGILAAATHGRGLWELEISTQAPQPHRPVANRPGIADGEVVGWWGGDTPKAPPYAVTTSPPHHLTTLPVLDGPNGTGTPLDRTSVQQYFKKFGEEQSDYALSSHRDQSPFPSDLGWTDVVGTRWHSAIPGELSTV
jgi:hypothetical protein